MESRHRRGVLHGSPAAQSLAEKDFFEAVAPVLDAFFRFLDREGLVKNGRALAQTALEVRARVVRAAQNPDNLGLAKTFAMSAINAGVDIHDEKSFRAYMLEYNLRARARFAEGSPGAALGALRSGNDLLRGQLPPTNRYDPCHCGSGKKYKFCCERAGQERTRF
jgi:hypothetical protein